MSLSFDETLGKRMPIEDFRKVTDMIWNPRESEMVALLSRDILRRAYEKDRSKLQMKRPIALIASSVYIAGVIHIKPPITQAEVHVASGVSEVSIRNRYRMILEILDLSLTPGSQSGF